MKALVVYDSIFGNTEKIARAIAGALGSPADVELRRPADFRPEELAGVDLFLVGSPTRGFKPTPAVQEMLKALPAGALAGKRVAAFDTRIVPRDTGCGMIAFGPLSAIFGYADRHISAALARAGAPAPIPAEGFAVKGSEGPLKPGEEARAEAWARQIAG